MSETPTTPASPPWGTSLKLVIGLTFVAIAAGLLIRFHTIIGPLMMAFILAYLLHPVANFMNRVLPISWRPAVNVIYLVFIVLFVGLLTLGGVGLVNQIQSLIGLIQNSLVALPNLIDQFSNQVIRIGTLKIDLATLDLNAISQQVLSFVQPVLGQTGTLVGTLATGAVEIFGWAAFVLVVSYFILIETGGLRKRILSVEIPGYGEDFRRLGKELGQIWNAFLRGQVIIFGLTLIVYTIVLSILGVRYAIGLALLAGLAKFLPYIGPAINWVVLGLVAFFQTYKLFGLQPFTYTIIVVGTALIIDQIFDNLISPRIMAQALRVHPAAVLVAALVAANLIGLLGVVIAAPILATLKLFGQYTVRKMLDMDPWPEPEEPPPDQPKPSIPKRLRDKWLSLRKKRSK
jgi:predicted PurR-regulated permease PerM